MLLKLKLDKEGTKEVTTLSDRLLFSWKTSLCGLLSGIYAIAQPFINKDTTLSALVHDQTFILALVGAAIGFLSKDATAHGTPSAPISVESAAKVAAVADNLPPAVAFVGGAVPGATDLYLSFPNDPTPVGATVAVGGQNFKKITTAYYEKV